MILETALQQAPARIQPQLTAARNAHAIVFSHPCAFARFTGLAKLENRL
jgi:hypothetical protein